MSELDYHREMSLPAGTCCDDCANARRCFAFGFARSGDTSCDFWPSRFHRAKPATQGVNEDARPACLEDVKADTGRAALEQGA